MAEPDLQLQEADADRFSLKTYSVPDLLLLFSGVLTELRGRGIVRSANNPVADYAEWLVAQAFGYELAGRSSAGYDAVALDGALYQVKGRRQTRENPSRQLSFIRGFDGDTDPFDYLIGILFNEDFTIWKAAQVPVAVVRKHSTWIARVNGWRFMLRDSVWELPGVVDVSGPLRRAASSGPTD